ncbi:undecaprenyl-diphosphate phosphatase [bacterium]|nr:undecaprenyl-diphosphate phosphatase [bacterium]
MQILQAIIMGIVQGLSEFLPISSSAHLVISSNLYKYFANVEHEQLSQEIFLDIMLHLGTLIAVLIFFRKDIKEIVIAFINGVKNNNYSNNNAKIALYIIIGTVITVLAALPMQKIAEFLVASPSFVGILLIITGLLLCISEAYSKKLNEKSSEIDFKTSVFVAISQGIAALPGFSRSGLTIATALLRKKDRVSAARYSFLLSIPIILGASMVYPFFSIDVSELSSFNWTAIIVGTIVSGIVGYLCIKYFIKFVGKYSLSFFGYYCIIVGGLTFLFFILH